MTFILVMNNPKADHFKFLCLIIDSKLSWVDPNWYIKVSKWFFLSFVCLYMRFPVPDHQNKTNKYVSYLANFLAKSDKLDIAIGRRGLFHGVLVDGPFLDWGDLTALGQVTVFGVGVTTVAEGVRRPGWKRDRQCIKQASEHSVELPMIWNA